MQRLKIELLALSRTIFARPLERPNWEGKMGGQSGSNIYPGWGQKFSLELTDPMALSFV